MDVHEFMSKMLRPTFVYRMAFGMQRNTGPAGGESARRRVENAVRDVDALVLERAETLGQLVPVESFRAKVIELLQETERAQRENAETAVFEHESQYANGAADEAERLIEKVQSLW